MDSNCCKTLKIISQGCNLGCWNGCEEEFLELHVHAMSLHETLCFYFEGLLGNSCLVGSHTNLVGLSLAIQQVVCGCTRKKDAGSIGHDNA